MGWSKLSLGFGISESVTLEMVYRQVRKTRDMLEELAEKSIVNVLPEEEVSEQEWKSWRRLRRRFGRENMCHSRKLRRS